MWIEDKRSHANWLRRTGAGIAPTTEGLVEAILGLSAVFMLVMMLWYAFP